MSAGSSSSSSSDTWNNSLKHVGHFSDEFNDARRVAERLGVEMEGVREEEVTSMVVDERLEGAKQMTDVGEGMRAEEEH